MGVLRVEIFAYNAARLIASRRTRPSELTPWFGQALKDTLAWPGTEAAGSANIRPDSCFGDGGS